MSTAHFNDPANERDLRPSVAMPSRPWVLPVAILFCIGLGALVFWQLNENRLRVEQAQLTDPAPGAAPIIGLDGVPPPPQPAPAPPPEPAPEPVAPQPVAAEAPPPSPELANRLRSPSLIVDLSEAREAGAAPGAAVNPSAVANLAAGRPGETRSADEQFAERMGVAGGAATARAQKIENPSQTVLQGAVIPAVLETAINSDLPGFTRAIVSRDVRSFDGKAVLAPRGSRLVGQYRSGVALGQSRAFVIWTRLIRPDGVYIDLDSPGSDSLGRAGLEGEVDSHFLQRFGGAILLSLITVGADIASNDRDTQVIINSSRSGADAAAVALGKNLDIAPTIKVPQGSPVRIFVARDLDFSGVAVP